jgi:hypothetical protein
MENKFLPPKPGDINLATAQLGVNQSPRVVENHEYYWNNIGYLNEAMLKFGEIYKIEKSEGGFEIFFDSGSRVVKKLEFSSVESIPASWNLKPVGVINGVYIGLEFQSDKFPGITFVFSKIGNISFKEGLPEICSKQNFETLPEDAKKMILDFIQNRWNIDDFDPDLARVFNNRSFEERVSAETVCKEKQIFDHYNDVELVKIPIMRSVETGHGDDDWSRWAGSGHRAGGNSDYSSSSTKIGDDTGLGIGKYRELRSSIHDTSVIESYAAKIAIPKDLLQEDGVPKLSLDEIFAEMKRRNMEKYHEVISVEYIAAQISQALPGFDQIIYNEADVIAWKKKMDGKIKIFAAKKRDEIEENNRQSSEKMRQTIAEHEDEVVEYENRQALKKRVSDAWSKYKDLSYTAQRLGVVNPYPEEFLSAILYDNEILKRYDEVCQFLTQEIENKKASSAVSVVQKKDRTTDLPRVEVAENVDYKYEKVLQFVDDIERLVGTDFAKTVLLEELNARYGYASQKAEIFNKIEGLGQTKSSDILLYTTRASDLRELLEASVLELERRIAEGNEVVIKKVPEKVLTKEVKLLENQELQEAREKTHRFDIKRQGIQIVVFQLESAGIKNAGALVKKIKSFNVDFDGLLKEIGKIDVSASVTSRLNEFERRLGNLVGDIAGFTKKGEDFFDRFAETATRAVDIARDLEVVLSPEEHRRFYELLLAKLSAQTDSMSNDKIGELLIDFS